MSWFPGYAVDVETGKQLNIFFGENSTYDCDQDPYLCTGILGENGPTGRDMIWNPGSEVFINSLSGGIYNWYAGGQHFIYVTEEQYDGCVNLKGLLNSNTYLAVRKIKWAGTILPEFGEELLSYEDGVIPNDVLIKLRVDNSYKNAIGTGENNGINKYLFSFDGAQADEIDSQQEVDNQLNAINVVPNPYYGYSAYETSQFTNTIKITNLPAKCKVTIYSLDGKFIRQYKRNEARMDKNANYAPILKGQISPAIEWDLKNNKGILVASGIYLIHIDADGLGERVIKWFGVARQFDPSGL